MEQKKPKSEIEVHIKGTNLIIFEYHSHDCIENLLKQAKEEYGSTASCSQSGILQMMW